MHQVLELLSVADHRALCLVNTEFRAIAEPFLYSIIQFDWQWDDDEPPPLIPELLRTLVASPQLGTYTRSFHLTADLYQRHKSKTITPEMIIAEPDLGLWIPAIQRTGVPFRDIWIQELRNGRGDAFIALLLAQLPNLKYLGLKGGFPRQTAWIRMMFGSALCESGRYTLPRFQHLRDVTFLAWEGDDPVRDQYGKNTPAILPFFYLPSLERMSASIENPEPFTWPVAELPAPEKLEFLDLRTGCHEHLSEILPVTQNLKVLDWRLYIYSGPKDTSRTHILELDPILPALSHVRNTLTDLTVMVVYRPFSPPIKVMGSLRGIVYFDNIKKLKAPWAMMVGLAKDTTRRLQDAIPRNVECVTITDHLASQLPSPSPGRPDWEWDDSSMIELLEYWLKEWRECTPRLRRVVLESVILHLQPEQWGNEARARLRDLGTRFGVLVDFVEVEY